MTTDIEHKLNHLYFRDSEEYLRYLNHIKSLGYKVLRNSKGVHKVKGAALNEFWNLFSDLNK